MPSDTYVGDFRSDEDGSFNPLLIGRCLQTDGTPPVARLFRLEFQPPTNREMPSDSRMGS